MAIDLSGINPAYPVEGVPTTASVRQNFAAVKKALEEMDDAKYDRSGGEITGNIDFTAPDATISALLSGTRRIVVKNSLTNQTSVWTIVPNGTSTGAQTNAHNSPDWQNSTLSRCGVAGTEVYHTGNNVGAGAPCTLYRWGPSLAVNWTMDADGTVTGAGGQSQFSNTVAGPNLRAGKVGVAGDAETRCWNNLGSVGLLQASTNAKGIACTGPKGEWDGWLIYRPSGSNVTYLDKSTPSAAAGPEVADAAFVRAVHASDERIKSDLQPVGSTLALLNGISAYTYIQAGYSERKLGTIAQDWQKNWPEVTPEIEYQGEKRLGIDPLGAIAILVEAVKELKKEVEGLKEVLRKAAG